MNMLKTTILCTGVALTVVACTGSGADRAVPAESVEPSSAPSLAAPPKPAPAQYDNARDKVSYDPCFELPDQVVTNLGFDARSRDRRDFMSNHYAFIGCDFMRKGDVNGQQMRTGEIIVRASNITLGEFREREGANAENIRIGARDGIRYPSGVDDCYIVFPFREGVLSVKFGTTPFVQENACELVVPMAEAIEATLPE